MDKLSIKDLRNPIKNHNGIIKGIASSEDKNYKIVYSETDKLLEFNSDRIDLETTPCNYGGVRYWFLCPYCGGRKTGLYVDNDSLICRQCLDVGYYSLRRTKTDCYYYFLQASKVALKIDKNFEWDGYPGNGKFPDRPKGMHQATYSKLFDKYKRYCAKGEQVFMSAVGRIMG